MCVPVSHHPSTLRATPTSSALLANLPLEVWQQIFTHACVDGGCTGYSLALVSRYFHNASHPVRFRSLIFEDLQRIGQFLAFVERHTSPGHGTWPKVHHLLLSFSRTSLQDTTDRVIGDDEHGWIQARRLREEDKLSWNKRFQELTSSLLDLVAPHLETLTVIQSDAFAIPAIRHTFPRLRELTLLVGLSAMLNEDDGIPSVAEPSVGSAPGHPPQVEGGRMVYPSPFLSSVKATATDRDQSWPWQMPDTPSAMAPAASSSGGPGGLDARYPALERLHIICGRYRDWTLREPLSLLPRLAPALTHLRISNITYTHGQDDCIPQFLSAALGATPTAPRLSSKPGGDDVTRAHAQAFETPQEQRSTSDSDDIAMRQPLLPRLRHVAVHSVLPPPGARGGCSYENYRSLVGAMREACCVCAHVVRVIWFETQRQSHRDWEQSVRTQWLEGVNCGRECRTVTS